jgi:crossover junction endodeoxyribonuclease RusA
MNPTTWTISFPAPVQLLSMNDRMHWRPEARLVRIWRTAAYASARQQHPGLRLPPCTVDIALPVKDRRRRDPANYHKTQKPCIDGMVDAGLWPDDTPEWVTTHEPTLIPAGVLVVITLTARLERA